LRLKDDELEATPSYDYLRREVERRRVLLMDAMAGKHEIAAAATAYMEALSQFRLAVLSTVGTVCGPAGAPMGAPDSLLSKFDTPASGILARLRLLLL